MIEPWRKVWREAIVPLLSDRHLAVLAEALRTGDPRLAQGYTTQPPPMTCTATWPVESACALSYCGWVGDGLTTVAEVEEFFGRFCYAIDQRLGETGGCRHFLNAFDEWRPDVMVANLLPEVERALAERAAVPADAPVTAP